MPAEKARLVINAYPVLVLSNEWLEELFCAACGRAQWFHLQRRGDGVTTCAVAPRELWTQVAHVDPAQSNPGVSEFSRRQALQLKPNLRYYG